MEYYQHPLDVTQLASWKALQEHRKAMQNFRMRDAFAADSHRFCLPPYQQWSCP